MTNTFEDQVLSEQDHLSPCLLYTSVASAEYAWIRLHGEAVFEDDKEVKALCMNNPIVKGQYETADNPIFVVFYLKNAEATIADFSGQPPKTYQL